MFDTKNLHQKIKKALNEQKNEKDSSTWSKKVWTSKVKSFVSKLAPKEGHQVYASSSKNVRGGEWLFDLIWVKGNYEENRIERVILAMESEWDRSKGSIDYDFQKLMVVRADLRVMLFNTKKKEKWEEIISSLKEQVKKFSQSQDGDRYLFGGWIDEKEAFEFEEYTYSVPQGRVRNQTP